MPYLIIAAGPTGSGKTAMTDDVLKQLGITGAETVRALVDDLVQADGEYKAAIRLAVQQEDPKERQAMFEAAYWAARRRGCKQPANGGCDAQNDANIVAAVANEKHLVFESTTATVPKWLLDIVAPKKYTVILGYNMVAFDQLATRNMQRAALQLEEFKKSGGVAPRLPDVGEGFREKVKQSVCSLRTLLQTCGAAGCPVSKLYLYDNNGESTALHRVIEEPWPADVTAATLHIFNEATGFAGETCPS